MWPCCCSYLTCADVWGAIRTLRWDQEEQEQESGVRMDMELLQQQYISYRDTQRRQTRVVCFRTAPDTEEISAQSLVDVFPVCQISHPASVLDVPLQCALASAGGPWRSHLNTCRLTHAEHRQHTADRSSTSSEPPASRHRPQSSRKGSAPVVLSRQLSARSSTHYPFPQRKSLRKSETARRLGLYASL